MPNEEEEIIARLRGEVAPDASTFEEPSHPAISPPEPPEPDLFSMPVASAGSAFQAPKAPPGPPKTPQEEVAHALDLLSEIEPELIARTVSAYLAPLDAAWETYEKTGRADHLSRAVKSLGDFVKLAKKAQRMLPLLFDRGHPDAQLIREGLADGALEDRERRHAWEERVANAWRGFLAAAGGMAREIEKDFP